MGVLPDRILLATDGSPDAALAARAAVDLSARGGVELHVAHVGRSLSAHARPASMPRDYSLLFAREADELLERENETIKQAGGTVARSHLRFGRPAEEILDLAGDIGAGMICVGSRGRGPVERLVMGSVSEDLVHRASCPVLIMRGGEGSWPPASVVIGDDSSGEATEAGRLGAGIGSLFGARGILVHAYPTLPLPLEGENALDARLAEETLRQAEKGLEERAGTLTDLLGRTPEVKVGVGDAAALILGVGREEGPALLAVGSRGLGGTERARRAFAALGSVSTKVVRASGDPVLVCPRRRTGSP